MNEKYKQIIPVNTKHFIFYHTNIFKKKKIEIVNYIKKKKIVIILCTVIFYLSGFSRTR